LTLQTRILSAALILYSLLSVLLIVQNPGLQYDEALLVLGSVQMRHSPQEINLPHDPNTWYCVHGRCFPLMTVRYAGAIKDYLCLPLFALFGASAECIRVISMLLGALGIWGLSRLVSRQVSAAQGAMAAIVLAMNPAYLNMTIFDNGAVAIWMGAFGLLCLTLNGYLLRCPQANAQCESAIQAPFCGRLLKSPAWAAVWLGCAMGLGVWARANFVWLLAAIFAAALIVLGRRMLVPVSHWGALAAGGAAGGAPFIAYQVHSGGGTWEALSMFQANEPLRNRLFTRLVLFSETLLADREHRAIWAGPGMPDWQPWFFLAVVVACCAVCLAARNRSWERGAALTFLFLSAALFFSKLAVSEHHLIVLLPLAAVVVVLGLRIINRRWLSIAIAVLYAGSALYWHVLEIKGLSTTGGVGLWSDSIYTLADYLEEKYPDQEVKILDWGLQNNLFVLTEGRLHTREIFGEPHTSEIEEVKKGGVFLLNGAHHRQFPAASEEFLKALEISHVPARHFVVRQENGAPYVEIVEINPGRKN
jgi:hypothetical protein